MGHYRVGGAAWANFKSVSCRCPGPPRCPILRWKFLRGALQPYLSSSTKIQPSSSPSLHPQILNMQCMQQRQQPMPLRHQYHGSEITNCVDSPRLARSSISWLR